MHTRSPAASPRRNGVYKADTEGVVAQMLPAGACKMDEGLGMSGRRARLRTLSSWAVDAGPMSQSGVARVRIGLAMTELVPPAPLETRRCRILAGLGPARPARDLNVACVPRRWHRCFCSKSAPCEADAGQTCGDPPFGHRASSPRSCRLRRTQNEGDSECKTLGAHPRGQGPPTEARLSSRARLAPRRCRRSPPARTGRCA